MNIISTVGLGFGDEGKGVLLNYIANKYKDTPNSLYIKSSGGCQGRHTVRLENGRYFSFSQLSPSIIYDKITYIREGFIFEPFALLNEVDALSKEIKQSKEKILANVYIDSQTICVTPYHKLYNQIEEETIHLRGSVGTGVSIAARDSLDDITLRVSDIGNKDRLCDILNNQLQYYINKCKLNGFNYDRIVSYNISEYIQELICIYNTYIKSCIVENFDYSGYNQIYECSQGVLLDKDYGIKPNTTYLSTTNNETNKLPDIRKIGVVRSIYTRHGPGAFPTEDDKLNSVFSDTNQEIGKYSGKIRFGYFDMVLYRYALCVTQVSEVFMTCTDYLNKLDTINICTSYLYTGKMDDDFEETFRYEIHGGSIYIKDIKNSTDRLKEFLDKSKPVYIGIGLKGKTFYERINNYFYYIEKNSGVPIKTISFGTNSKDILER